MEQKHFKAKSTRALERQIKEKVNIWKYKEVSRRRLNDSDIRLVEFEKREEVLENKAKFPNLQMNGNTDG